MPQRTGSMQLADLLANRIQSVAEFGESSFNEVLTNDLAAHNRNTAELMRDLAVTSIDRQRIAGDVGDETEMEESNEFTRPDTQMAGASSSLGFPLRFKTYGLSWTRRWFQLKKVADVAEQVVKSKKAHVRALARDMKKAIYGSTNYTFRDDLDAPVLDLEVKRFCNADSFPIPSGPNGESFDSSTHTHFTASQTLTAPDIAALVLNITEHGHVNDVRIVIALANVTAFSALSGFTAFKRADLILSNDEDQANQRLQNNPGNRPIGYFGEFATVWVKPWAVAGYAFCYAASDDKKPLVLRTRNGQSPDLVVAAELEAYPMRAQYMESEFGVGCWNRTNGAVHQWTAAVDDVYEIPTIT